MHISPPACTACLMTFASETTIDSVEEELDSDFGEEENEEIGGEAE